MAADPQRLSRFNLPGFNLPLNYTPNRPYKGKIYDDSSRAVKDTDFVSPAERKDLFPSALNPGTGKGGSSLPLTTLREFTMMQMLNYITDKLDWESKVFDEKIVDKWKTEIQRGSQSKEDLKSEEDSQYEEVSQSGSREISDAMFQWIIQELRYKAKIFAETGAISLYNGDVVKSDSKIPESLREALKSAVSSLEAIPEVYKDYHPGSDGKVIDLVHPSLFPLIYGRSRILPDRLVGVDNCLEMIGLGLLLSPPSGNDATQDEYLNQYPNLTMPYSKNYQWLPCEIEFSGSDDEVKITSYINNLHPHKHRDLYTVIEKIISRAISLWNSTLTPSKDSGFQWKRIEFSGPTYDPDPESLPEEEQLQQGENERDDDFWERKYQWEESFRRQHLVQPEPGVFKLPPKTSATHPAETVDLKRDYGDRGLQVIVKLATICLTPEKPSYEGGSWHVEGQMNEHICATALCYYDNTNITESQLAFRQMFDEEETIDILYNQNDWVWSRPIIGLENDDACVQDVGSVVCKEGRLITFPNILQHCVRPFELEDHTKPGHRKILALFLVDPNIRIISTANIPPQQRDWWSEELKVGGYFKQLAPELQEKIFESVDDFPIGMDEAKEIRLKLMDERKEYVKIQNEGFRYATFSLCEH